MSISQMGDLIALALSVVSLSTSAVVFIWAWRKSRSEVHAIDSGAARDRADAAGALVEGSLSLLDPLNERIDSLETNVTSLQVTNAELTHRLDVRGSEIAILQRRVTERDVRIAELEKQQASNVNALARMTAQVEYLRGRNLLLENWADRLSTQVVRLGGDPEPLEGV